VVGYKGIVEGFYWIPKHSVNWRYGEFDPIKRMKLLEFMGKKKLNTYVYDPKHFREGKNGIYERAYNPTLIGDPEQWKDTFSVAKDNGIEFIWGIAPGTHEPWTTYHPGWKKNEDGIFNVIEKLLELGVSGISLLFDDSPGGDSNIEVEKQAYLACKIADNYPGILKMICPTEYYGSKKTLEQKHKILNENTPASIGLIFTGTKSYCRSISSEDVPDYKNGRGSIVWDNWMAADDNNPKSIEFNLPQDRSQSLFDKIDGYLLNPCFPVERIVHMVSGIGEIIEKKIETTVKKTAQLPNGNDISWYEHTDEVHDLLQTMGKDWAEFLDVNASVMQKLLIKKVLDKDLEIKESEYREVIKKWPSLDPFFTL
jgi:hypothetical protein